MCTESGPFQSEISSVCIASLHLLQEIVRGFGIHQSLIVQTASSEVSGHDVLRREEGMVGEIQCGES